MNTKGCNKDSCKKSLNTHTVELNNKYDQNFTILNTKQYIILRNTCIFKKKWNNSILVSGLKENDVVKSLGCRTHVSKERVFQISGRSR